VADYIYSGVGDVRKREVSKELSYANEDPSTKIPTRYQRPCPGFPL